MRVPGSGGASCGGMTEEEETVDIEQGEPQRSEEGRREEVGEPWR